MDTDVSAYFLAQLEKLRCLRQTARGEVWLALLPTRRLVVWKRIHAAGLPYALLASRPPHPLWPEILYCAEDEAETVVVEDYVQGEPLSARLEQERFLPESEAASLLLQIAEGLIVLHGLGIIHRDIKPSNLILTESGEIRLIDFDAARTVKEEQAEDTALLGTKGYAPPEQFGYGQTDARSDLYALGVTFRALLGAGYSGWLSPILAKCTELDPNRRYASAAELKHAILMRRRWAKAKTGCFAALAILVGAALYFLPAPAPAPPSAVEEKAPLPSGAGNASPPSSQESQSKNEPKENDAPRTGTEPGKPQDVGTAQEETAREEPPELPKTAKGYVRATYYLNEKRLGAWTDRFDYPINNWGTTTFVRQEEWETWRTAEGGASLPAAWTLRVHIENLTDTPFESARLHLEYDDRGRIETDIMRAGTIPPGEETDLVVPLGRYHIDAPETENPHPTLKLSLFGEGAQEIRGKQTEWSIDLVPSGKKSASDIIEEQTRR